MEHAMDELPDLQSDADVDALMARLRARIDVHTVTSSGAARGQPAGEQPNGLGDLLAAQDTFAAAVVRAMELMVATLEEVTAGDVRLEPDSTSRRESIHEANSMHVESAFGRTTVKTASAPRSAKARRRPRRTAR
jgi:hypothetical protein